MHRFTRDNQRDFSQDDPQLDELLDDALAPELVADDVPVSMLHRILALTTDVGLLDEALSPAGFGLTTSADLVDRILAVTAPNALTRALDAALAPATVPGGVPAGLVDRLAHLTSHSLLLDAALGPETLPCGVPAELLDQLSRLTQTPRYDVELFDQALGPQAIEAVPAHLVDRVSALTQDATLLDQALAAESASDDTTAYLVRQIEDLTTGTLQLDAALAPSGAFEASAALMDRIATASQPVLARYAAVEHVVDLSRDETQVGQPLPFPTDSSLPAKATASASTPVAQSIFDTHEEFFEENATRSLTALLPHLNRRARESDGRRGLSAMLGPRRTRIARQLAAAVILAAELGIWFTLVTIADDARAIVALDQELEQLADSSAQLEPMVTDQLDEELELLRHQMLDSPYVTDWSRHEADVPTLDEALNDFTDQTPPYDF